MTHHWGLAERTGALGATVLARGEGSEEKFSGAPR